MLYPLLTLKVAGGIHGEALKLWRKGVKVHQTVTTGVAGDCGMGRN